MFLRIMTICCLLLFCPAVHAEVIELEGTVKSIDKDARTLSVVRKTPKGEKVLDLEVAKKAGDLSEVKEGDTVSFSYDPDLELITKIAGKSQVGGASDGDKSSGDREPEKVSRFTVEITSRGGVTFSLEQVPDTPFPEAPGVKADLSMLSGATIHNDDGFFYVDYECDKQDVVASLGREGLQVRKESLVVDVGVGKDDRGQRNFLGNNRPSRLPFTIQMDNARQGTVSRTSASQNECSMNYHFDIKTPGGPQVSHLWLSIQPTDSFFRKGKVLAAVTRPNDPSQQTVEREIKDGAASFRLQMPGATDEMALTWYCVVRGEPARVERVRIASPLIPVLGVAFGGVAGEITVQQVFKNTTAEKGGLKTGDVLVSINGKRMRDVESSVAAIGSLSIGDAVELTIKRDGKEMELKLKAD